MYHFLASRVCGGGGEKAAREDLRPQDPNLDHHQGDTHVQDRAARRQEAEHKVGSRRRRRLDSGHQLSGGQAQCRAREPSSAQAEPGLPAGQPTDRKPNTQRCG